MAQNRDKSGQFNNFSAQATRKLTKSEQNRDRFLAFFQGLFFTTFQRATFQIVATLTPQELSLDHKQKFQHANKTKMTHIERTNYLMI